MLGGENWATDLVSALAAIGSGYLFTSWQKATTNPLIPLVGEGVVGAGAIGAKHLTRNRYTHEILEALGYGSLFGIGTWAAEATTTIGGKGPGAPAVFLPGTSSSKSSVGAARVAAIAAARAAAAAVPVSGGGVSGFGSYDANFDGE